MVSLQNFLQLDDYNGVPLAAGKIYVYHQGRTELAEIYSDINGETPIANPAVLDDLGMQEIYVSNVYNYSVVVTDPYNNELFTRDIYPNGVDGDGNNRLYEGIDPIVVNNDKMAISAKKATLSVQDPLYFVEDSQSAVCIGLQESAYSGLPYIENSAIELDPNGNISAISGHQFHSDSAESAGIVTDGWETGSDGRITAYNGTAFSAGKVYSGISPVYVNNESDLIGVSSKDFLANSPLYFTEYSDRVELSISGLPDTPGLMYESGFNYESGKITGYNGSGISAGKVYTGISPVTVDNDNDTISVASAILGVQAPLYFVEDSESATILGVDTSSWTIDIPESANWNKAYSTVNNNSASWTSAADELAVLNTAKWDSTCDYVSSHSADWNNKLDADIYAEDSGTFLTALPADVVYTADIQNMATTGDINDLVTSIAETYQTTAGMTAYATKDFVNDNVASSISGKLDIATYSSESGNFLTGLPSDLVYTADLETVSAEITGMIPTALTGDYIETSAMKSAQLGTSAFITGFYDGQISAALANEANKAVSANHADSAATAGSAHSASYVYSGWGVTPTLYHTDSAIKEYYAVTGRVQGFPAGTLYKFNAYSADSAAVAASAEKAEKDSLGNIIAITYLTANRPIPQSADWDSAAATVSAGYTLWDASYGTLTANSANWDSTYTTVSDNSASWTGGSTYTGDAQGALDEVYSNSANWNSTYTMVSSNSATWGQGGGGMVVIDVSTGTIDWQSVYTTINSNWGTCPIYLKSRYFYLEQPTDIYYHVNAREVYDTSESETGYNYHAFATNPTNNMYNCQLFKCDCYYSVGESSYGGNMAAMDMATTPPAELWDAGKVLGVNVAGYPEWQTPQGGALPQSASDAIDVVTGGSANWNSTTATVATNSGAWGGQGIELSAGFGIDIQMVDNKLVISLATATGDI